MAYNNKLLEAYFRLLADGTPSSSAARVDATPPAQPNHDAAAPSSSPPPPSTTAMYRDAADQRRWKCRTCPYCNGTRDATIKHSGTPKKPSDPFTFWKNVCLTNTFTASSDDHALLAAQRNLAPYPLTVPARATTFSEEEGSPQSPTPKAPLAALVVAPMVDQSELPFRMLCRRYGATLAYTPMFHSKSFAESAEYRNHQYSTVPEDRPLFVQFCSHEPDVLLAAARHVEDSSDAVDLNLGCPQGIARRGFYGSFLMEHWDLIHTMLHTLAVELRIPVTAKMRIFDDEALTLAYAEMLRDAGAYVVAVHGRTREQKGQVTGLADLEQIRKVRDHIGHSVPVIANGNILTYADIEPNLTTTRCDGVMSAEALLWDPRLFANPAQPVVTGRQFHMEQPLRFQAIDTALEYLDLVEQYPVDFGFVKAHLFKILYHSYEVFQTMRGALGDFDVHTKDLAWLRSHVQELKALEVSSGPIGSLVKTSTAEKIAAKEAVRESIVEDCECYDIDFSHMLS